MRRVFRHVMTGLVSILLDAIILSSRLQAGRGRRRKEEEEEERGRRRRQREVSSALGSPRRAAARRNALPAPATPPGGERPHTAPGMALRQKMSPGDTARSEGTSSVRSLREQGSRSSPPDAPGSPP